MPKKKYTGRKRGPKGPMKAINWEHVQALCAIQCTQQEIASVLNLDTDTLQNRCKKEKGMNFSEFFPKSRMSGFTSLRRKQWEVAMRGNPQMLIFLGENWLGQSRNANIRHSGYIESSPAVELEKLTESEARTLLALMDKANADIDEVHPSKS